MLLNQANLKAHVAAAQKGRYALNAIALCKTGSISTDGHALLHVPYPQAALADAPAIAGVNPTAPTEEPVLLDPKDAARAAAMLGKRKRGSNPFAELVQLEVRGEELVLGATDLVASQTMKCRRVEGEFPAIGVVIPDYAKALAVTVEIELLLRSLKAMQAATRSDTVTLRVIDDQQAIGLSCADGVALIVMPYGVEKPEDHCPDKLALLRESAPPAQDACNTPVTTSKPSQPAPDEAEEADEADEDWQPTEAEMEAAYEELQKLGALPLGPHEQSVPAVAAE